MSRFAKKGFAKLKLLANFETPLYNYFRRLSKQALWQFNLGTCLALQGDQLNSHKLLLPKQKCLL